jgi:hypothetical protein
MIVGAFTLAHLENGVFKLLIFVFCEISFSIDQRKPSFEGFAILHKLAKLAEIR